MKCGQKRPDTNPEPQILKDSPEVCHKICMGQKELRHDFE
jgi:hypothetical protein